MARKTKIGISCHPTMGGSGVVATELGIGLSRIGYEVHFIAHSIPARLRHLEPNIFFHQVDTGNYPVFLHPPYALALAAKGAGFVSPNPMVGAVFVREGRIVGRGFHRRFGGAHAEVAAIRAAGTRAKGATLYLNLEPCCHFGKTPPCTEAILKAGVRRVVAAMRALKALRISA